MGTKKEDKTKERRDRGQVYLTELLARVPEDRRESLEEVLKADEVLDHLGEGVLRQSDYSRNMNEAKKAQESLGADVEKYQKLYDDNVRWRQAEELGVKDMKTKIERYEAVLAADPLLGGDGGDGDGPVTTPGRNNGVDLSDYIKREDAEKALQERLEVTERNGVHLMAMLSTIQAKHLKQFDEALDAQELFEHATKVNLPLPAAYQDFISKRVEESREEAHKEEIKRAREEGRIEALRTPLLPHNVGNNEPTVLDALTVKDRSEFGLSKAVDDYWHMQSEKQKNATS